jgi:hypothetical protein
MKKFLRLAAAVWIVLLSSVALALRTGQTKHPSSRVQLLHFDICVWPCWIAIVPGQSTLADARAQIDQTYGDPERYFLNFRPDLPNQIEFTLRESTAPPESSVVITLSSYEGGQIVDDIHFKFSAADDSPPDRFPTIGEVMAIWGSPSQLWLNDIYNYFIIYGNAQRGALLAPYPSLAYDNPDWKAPISEIELYAHDLLPGPGYVWQGFMALCQYERTCS